MVPFCDPAGWVESFGPVLGPILAALSVVAYPVALMYQSLLAASAAGKWDVTLGPAVGEAVLTFFLVAAVAVLIVAIVGAVLLGGLITLLIVLLRALFKPTPVNEPWVPRRLGRRTPSG